MKRAVDVSFGAIILVLGFPIFLLAAVAILVDDGPPIVFARSAREGREGGSRSSSFGRFGATSCPLRLLAKSGWATRSSRVQERSFADSRSMSCLNS